MCEVKVFDGNVEKAMKILKKKLDREGVFLELRKRKYYRKPSVKKREKHMAALRKLRKRLRKICVNSPG